MNLFLFMNLLFFNVSHYKKEILRGIVGMEEKVWKTLVIDWELTADESWVGANIVWDKWGNCCSVLQ